ncbi:ATP-binding protein [Streptomyces sp. 3MP-14]|uniref:histidine kinase n=1 Tax=Streptomyces mimosae TaxID=2586635 RepID=A0A5N6AE84_9ACTN|nr:MULTISPECIES: ATP-binding protein [Streptomyces]KAB8166492.1 ATP-binding protein [Streptomyces mimosae]KAB8178921.1 ATP-binding protein [Streptomyces sp. 3MP-14]
MPVPLRQVARTARHGRPTGRGSVLREPGFRRRLLALAVLPAAVVALLAALAVGYVLQSRPAVDGQGSDGALWAVLTGGTLLTGAVLALAATFAGAEAAGQAGRLHALRRQAARGRVELQALLDQVERGERIRPPESPAPTEPGDQPLDQLRHEIAVSRHAAQAAVAQAVALADERTGTDERVEVFVNLARRVQSFVHQQIEYLDELEHDVEDPELLKGLFHLDHLATRIRRHAENLAVLGGAISRRQWSRPVRMSEVLRSCIAEVEQYSRVKLVPPVEGTVRGHAVADVVHLLAELVENATEFSAPGTQVLLRVEPVTAGLAIEVEDRGLGMTPAEQSQLNAVLAGTERHSVAALLEDGRVGLFVVATLARRHRIGVRLQSNIYGGVQAVLVLPHELLGDEAEGHFTPGRTLGPPLAATRFPSAPSTAEAATPVPLPPTVTAPDLPVPAAGAGPDHRPPLPRRRRQQHLVPQLRDAMPPRPEPVDEAAEPPDPGLMAAFRRGASLAEEAEPRHS